MEAGHAAASPVPVVMVVAILRFKETEKELILNKTNAKGVAKVLGESRASNCPGSKVTLKPTQCEAFGEIVDCIRVEMHTAS